MPHTLRPGPPAVDASSWLDETALRDGDVLLTYGKGGLWPPRRWLLWLVHRAIRKFQQRRWGTNADYGPTHVRLWLHGRFFEATVPICRWTAFATLHLERKAGKLVRYHGRLDESNMLQEAYRLVHTPYDKGDLLDFALSGWLGRAAHLISLFGDRANKYRVCSTAAAQVLAAGGAKFDLPVTQIDPAYFANNPDQWKVIAQS